MTPNERAYELLRWQAIAPLAEYQETLDYVTIQRQRSDIALDQWDKENPYESSPELTAFRELEHMGQYTQHDYYSPSKAANGFYTAQLRGINDGSIEPSGRVRRIKAGREIRGRKLPSRRTPRKIEGGGSN